MQKERDLELAARIGQSLLKQNQDLTARNERLDEQLELAKEEVNIKLGVKTGECFHRSDSPTSRGLVRSAELRLKDLLFSSRSPNFATSCQ